VQVKALTVVPLHKGSAELSDVDEPPETDGPVLVETLGVGICGTDIEILSGEYGWPPPGRDRLVLGHESLGRVIDAPAGGPVAKGDLVVGIVRRPDPVPCGNCAVGEWDFCRNGLYTERGIKEHDGYLSERYRILPEYVVKVDPSLGLLGVLLEPTSVVAKAWEQVERIGHRAHWEPKTAVITGAGPIGLLAALMGVQRGIEVHVIDQMTGGKKPDLVRALGAQYHTGSIEDACEGPDIVIECTGVSSLVLDAMEHVGSGGVVCLTGVSSGGRTVSVDEGALNRTMVLSNESVVGSVNANRRHYEAGAEALAKADRGWLEQVVSRKVPIDRWQDALDRQPDDVKVVVEVSAT
jgi:glucose 1-dehydrogenase